MFLAGTLNESQTFIPYSQQATPPMYFWKFSCNSSKQRYDEISKGPVFVMKHGVQFRDVIKWLRGVYANLSTHLFVAASVENSTHALLTCLLVAGRTHDVPCDHLRSDRKYLTLAKSWRIASLIDRAESKTRNKWRKELKKTKTN